MPRVAPPAPEIEGYQHQRPLGSGGFADVYLYTDHLERNVAVKVLRNTLDDAETREAFQAESRLMAKVSGHPFIVEIYTTGVASDGRPYIVMQYYPNPAYSQRIKTQPLSLSEGLATGVQICSAVEAAHRAGIIHRDIKPANLLTDQYGKPGLSDFGISGTHSDDSLGYSPPYAAPEVIEDTSPGDQRSDVYSLAATIYALLVGRSPFETESGDNTRSAVTERVLNSDPLPTGRRDVPSIFERLLAQSMSKNPAHRPQSARALARSLQQVQQNLQHSQTEFLMLSSATGQFVPVQEDDDESGRTKFGGVQVIDPEISSQRRGSGSSTDLISQVPTSGAIDAPAPTPFEVDSRLPEPAEEMTVREPTIPTQRLTEPLAATAPKQQAPRWQLMAAVAAVVVVVAIAAFTLLTGGGEPEAESTATTVGGGALVIVDTPEPPADVEMELVDGLATVTWAAPGAQDGDQYQVIYRFGLGSEPNLLVVDEIGAEITDVPAGSEVCVEVLAMRRGRFSDSSPIVCEGGN